MTISLCGSTNFYDDMDKIQNQLEKLGIEVHHPRTTAKDFSKDLTNLYKDDSHKINMSEEGRKLKKMLIDSHLSAIKNSDAILVINLEKKGQKNYIGGNTFLEMGFAYCLNKKIYVLNDLPTNNLNYDELTGLMPIVINNDLNKIKNENS